MKFEVKLRRMLDHTATIIIDAVNEDSAVDEANRRAVNDEIKDWELENEEFEIVEIDGGDEEEEDDDGLGVGDH